MLEIEPWEVLDSNVAFSSPWLKVRQDLCRTSGGNTVDYYVVERFSYVAVVALTPDSEVLVVRQYKHGAAQVVRELPAGYIEDGEDPLECAHRELREETGYEADHMEALGVLFASPSASSHRAHLFLATGLHEAGEQQLDAAESILVEKMALRRAVQAAARGQVFQDLTSAAALLMAWHRIRATGHKIQDKGALPNLS
jgi:8-oxo-dGTP pyrophosphatase MutT (NUDIX family)